MNRAKSLRDAVVERLYKYMGEKDLSIYRLSQLSGVPFPTLKSIMQGRTKGIALKTVILLAHGLGITPSEFLDCELFNPENLDLD